MINSELKVLPTWTVNFFLWLGLIAGICVRSLMILSRISPDTAVWVWRFAMLAYTFFFGYRFMITRRRRRVVSNHGLIEKISAAKELDPETQAATLYILRSIIRSKELFNYAFISLLSLSALILDFFVD